VVGVGTLNRGVERVLRSIALPHKVNVQHWFKLRLPRVIGDLRIREKQGFLPSFCYEGGVSNNGWSQT
jgi:hypothetical protein